MAVPGTFTIGQMAELTGLSEATLRQWERRFSFPLPARSSGGQRRYDAADVESIRTVDQARRAGLSLAAAIESLRVPEEAMPATVFSLLRERHRLPSYRIGKKKLDRVARAFEDEIFASARRPVLIGAFQQERFYRRSAERWQDLARAVDVAVARATFPVLREVEGVHEVPIALSDPLAREWSGVVYEPGFGATYAAWELSTEQEGESDRCFEMVWTVESEVAYDAARQAARLTAGEAPELSRHLLDRLGPAPPSGSEDIRRLIGFTNRLVGYLAA